MTNNSGNAFKKPKLHVQPWKYVDICVIQLYEIILIYLEF